MLMSLSAQYARHSIRSLRYADNVFCDNPRSYWRCDRNSSTRLSAATVPPPERVEPRAAVIGDIYSDQGVEGDVVEPVRLGDRLVGAPALVGVHAQCQGRVALDRFLEPMPGESD